jgi:hypothetical protein
VAVVAVLIPQHLAQELLVVLVDLVVVDVVVLTKVQLLVYQELLTQAVAVVRVVDQTLTALVALAVQALLLFGMRFKEKQCHIGQT